MDKIKQVNIDRFPKHIFFLEVRMSKEKEIRYTLITFSKFQDHNCTGMKKLNQQITGMS